MKEVYRKLERHGDERKDDRLVLVRAPNRGVDLIDYLFDLIIPGEEELRFPDDFAWRTMSNRILKRR